MRPYYRPQNYTMRNSVGYLMRICTNRVLPQMEALFEDEELTFSQWTTLVALHDGRVSTAGDLANNICHDAGSLTRMIDQLEKRGFVSRARDENDRRVVRLALTPRGRGVVEALAPRVMHFWNGLLSGFSHAEVDMLINFLTRLVLAAEGTARRSSRSPVRSSLPFSDAPIARTVEPRPASPISRPTSRKSRAGKSRGKTS